MCDQPTIDGWLEMVRLHNVQFMVCVGRKTLKELGTGTAHCVSGGKARFFSSSQVNRFAAVAKNCQRNWCQLFILQNNSD